MHVIVGNIIIMEKNQTGFDNYCANNNSLSANNYP